LADVIEVHLGCNLVFSRSDMQYYSDRNISDELYLRITAETALFLVKCKQVLNNITESVIEGIREEMV